MWTISVCLNSSGWHFVVFVFVIALVFKEEFVDFMWEQNYEIDGLYHFSFKFLVIDLGLLGDDLYLTATYH